MAARATAVFLAIAVFRRDNPRLVREVRACARPPKLTDDHIALAQRLYHAGENTVAQIAAMLDVPRTTVYGHLNKNKSASTSPAHPPGDIPVNSVAPLRVPNTCPTCGYEPSTRAEAAHQRGDLAVAWLHPDLDDPNAVVIRSRRRQCEPEPPAFDVACAVCGDGPILAAPLLTPRQPTVSRFRFNSG